MIEPRLSFARWGVLLCLLAGGCLDVAFEESFRGVERNPEARKGERRRFAADWKPGGAGDQSKSGDPTDHSALTAVDGIDVTDAHLATRSVAPAFAAKAEIVWVFAQCFGGGMFDELAAKKGVQVMTSAARFDEMSYYRKRVPGGVGADWLDRYIAALIPGKSARAVSLAAAAEDPFGINPLAMRRGEAIGSEHPQLFQTPLAAGRLLPGADKEPVEVDGRGGTSLAVLWSGKPHVQDGEQVDRAIHTLLALGYSRDRIVVLYGTGRLTGAHRLVKNHIIGRTPPIELRAATRRQLDGTLTAAFAAATAPTQVFFMANDHGTRTVMGVRRSVRRVVDATDQDNPEDSDASSPQGDYGGGDDDNPPAFD